MRKDTKGTVIGVLRNAWTHVTFLGFDWIGGPAEQGSNNRW